MTTGELPRPAWHCEPSDARRSNLPQEREQSVQALQALKQEIASGAVRPRNDIMPPQPAIIIATRLSLSRVGRKDSGRSYTFAFDIE